MSEKRKIDKEYLTNTLKDFDNKILSKKYSKSSVPTEDMIDFLEEQKYFPEASKEYADTIETNIKNGIMNNFQNVLNEEIEMGFFTINDMLEGNTDTRKLTIRNDELPFIASIKSTYPGSTCHKLKIGGNGGVKLTARKTYLLNAGFQMCTDTSAHATRERCGYNIYDITHEKTIIAGNLVQHGRVDMNSEDGDSARINYPFTPEEDCEITLCFLYSENVELNINRSYLSIIELKQPVMTNVTIEDYIQSHKTNSQDTPVGNIISYMGTTPPENYLFCDGTEYQISDYPDLAQHFIDDFGVVNYFGGDGMNTFAVPDLRGEFLRGAGANIHDNQGSGSNVGEHQDATLLPLSYANFQDSNSINISSLDLLSNPDWQRYPNTKSRIKLVNSTVGSNLGLQVTTRPTNTSVQYCIKCHPTYCLRIDGSTITIDSVIEGLTEKQYLKGLVSEEKVTEEINFHTETMKDEIRKGYQKILDEPIEYITAEVFNPEDKLPDSILTFERLLNLDPNNETTKPSRLIRNNMEIGQDGYIELKAGHTYCIQPNIMVRDFSAGNLEYTSDLGFAVVDRNGIDIGNGENFYDKLCPFYAEANIFSSMIYPFIYMANEDCGIALRIQKDSFTKARITSYVLSVFELKQPVHTKITPAQYSESEHIVGTWIDGKVLYEKTVIIPDFYKTVGWNIYPHNIEEADFVFIKEGFVHAMVDGLNYNNNICNNQNWVIDYSATNEDIRFKIGKAEDTSVSTGYITIRYTKL